MAQATTLLPSISSRQRTLTKAKYRPTFSVVDISYDDFAQDLPGFKTEAFAGSSNTKTFRTDSERVTLRSTMVTLPIIVIGFSSTIVVCALFVIISEFRARRKYGRDVMTDSSSGTCNNMKSSASSAQPSYRNVSGNSKSSDIDGVFLHNGSNINGSDEQNDDECGINHVSANDQPFLCDKNLHRDREIYFYRSEDSSMSIASTITGSLPSQSRTQNIYSSPSRCNKIRDCKIMELTDIHRVSTSMDLEDLVELSTISATKFATKVAQDEVPVAKLPGTENRDTKDNCNNEAETKDGAISDIDVQKQPEREIQNTKKYIISDFDAGNLYITEVMANDDCSFIAEKEDTGGVNIQGESAEKRVCECKDLKRGDSNLAITTPPTPNIPPSSTSSDNDVTPVTTHSGRGSLNTISSVEELESPTPALMLGEHSPLAFAKENGCTKTENKHRIVQLGLDEDDCESLSGITEALKTRACDDWVDSVRSSSSASTDVSTEINPKRQEGQAYQEVDSGKNDLNQESL